MLRREPRPQHEVPLVTELCRVPCGSDRVVMAAVERREARTDNVDARIRQPVVLGGRAPPTSSRIASASLTTAELEQREREERPERRAKATFAEPRRERPSFDGRPAPPPRDRRRGTARSLGSGPASARCTRRRARAEPPGSRRRAAPIRPHGPWRGRRPPTRRGRCRRSARADRARPAALERTSSYSFQVDSP